MIMHNGSIDGFRSAMAFYPDDDLVVIVLSNVETARSEALQADLAKVALGDPVIFPFERTAIILPTSTLEKYAGDHGRTFGRKRAEHAADGPGLGGHLSRE